VTARGARTPRPIIRVLFWAAGLFAFVMAVLPHPPEIPGHPSDKVQHMAAFAVLGLLGSFAFPRRTLPLLAGLSFFGALIEVAQEIPMLHRDSDPMDWLADTIACAVVILAVHLWTERKR
jgi:hypothetical protein